MDAYEDVYEEPMVKLAAHVWGRADALKTVGVPDQFADAMAGLISEVLGSLNVAWSEETMDVQMQYVQRTVLGYLEKMEEACEYTPLVGVE